VAGEEKVAIGVECDVGLNVALVVFQPAEELQPEDVAFAMTSVFVIVVLQPQSVCVVVVF